MTMTFYFAHSIHTEHFPLVGKQNVLLSVTNSVECDSWCVGVQFWFGRKMEITSNVYMSAYTTRLTQTKDKHFPDKILEFQMPCILNRLRMISETVHSSNFFFQTIHPSIVWLGFERFFYQGKQTLFDAMIYAGCVVVGAFSYWKCQTNLSPMSRWKSLLHTATNEEAFLMKLSGIVW